MSTSIHDLVLTYFKNHPNQEIEHGPVVDWVTAQWLHEHDNPPRDPWRSIRALHQKGILIKVKKGIYKYDPTMIDCHEFEDFNAEQKEQIFKRDNYRCVICGRGRQDGVEIHADHIKPKDKGGRAVIEMGKRFVPNIIFLKNTIIKLKQVKRCLFGCMNLLNRKITKRLSLSALRF